jgi:hypothetical protein
MAVQWEQVVVVSVDPRGLALWWAQALDWLVTFEEPGEIEIRATPDATPGLVFVHGPQALTRQNRLHIDLRPDDQEAEVRRLLDHGARPVDIGQGDVPWVVLSDPEGNVFCVLTSPATPTSDSAGTSTG